MIKEFRDFLLRGNVVDLAVAVVIGAAFGAVVNSFVKDILTPLLGLIGVPGTPEMIGANALAIATAEDRVRTARTKPMTPHTSSAAKVLSQVPATAPTGLIVHAEVDMPAPRAAGHAAIRFTTVATVVAATVTIVNAATLPATSRHRWGCAAASSRTSPVL